MSAVDLVAAMVLDDQRRWGEVATGWQRADAEAVLDAEHGPHLHWLGRPKGASKTTDLAAVSIAWLVEQAPVLAEGFALAADLDQSGRLLRRAKGLIQRTPGLERQVSVQANKIIGPNGATVEALAADEAGTEGILSPFVVVDELPNWKGTPAARKLWTAAVSSIPKWPGMRFVVIGHAGDPAHWSHKVLEQARRSPRWRVVEIPGPLSWADPADLEEQRDLLLPSEFARRHLNRWTAGEDRLTSLEDVRACVGHVGDLEPVRGRRYVMALDLGLKKDRTVLSVAHAEQAAEGVRVVLDRQRVWQGSRLRPVSIGEVEATILEAHRAYGRPVLILDPWQAAQLTERLRAKGVRVVEFTFSQASIGRVAVALFRLLRDHMLDLPDDADLVDELVNVVLLETAPGVYRVDHASGGHDDRVVSLGLAVHELLGEGVSAPARTARPTGRLPGPSRERRSARVTSAGGKPEFGLGRPAGWHGPWRGPTKRRT